VESTSAHSLATPIVQSAFTSTHGDSHFSLIQESLAEIKDRLGKLEQSQEPQKLPFEVHVVSTERNASSDSGTIFQNEPSFNNQSAQASLSAELSAEESHVTDFDQEIQLSLAFLKSRLQGESLPAAANNLYFPCSSARSSTENVELPPVSIVLSALRRATGLFNCICR
jgi:hypothetical protein